MPNRFQKPKISHDEVLDEVSKRSGVPFYVVHRILKEYQEVLKQCLLNGVQAKIGELGVMSWKVKAPHRGVVYYNIKTREPMPPQDVPGFWIPSFIPSRKFKKELRAKTEYWEKEENENEDE